MNAATSLHIVPVVTLRPVIGPAGEYDDLAFLDLDALHGQASIHRAPDGLGDVTLLELVRAAGHCVEYTPLGARPARPHARRGSRNACETEAQ